MLFDYESGIPELFKRKGGFIPGQIAKTGWKRVEPVNSSSPSEAIEFGQVVKRVPGFTPIVTAIDEDDDPVRFFGIAVKDVTSEAIANLDLTNPRLIKRYFSGSAISVMTEGYVCVPVQNGNPVVGDPVYVRVTPSETNSDLPIGGIETAGVGCVKWKGARFESDAFYPFKGTNNGTSSNGTTSKCAIISLVEERYGLIPTIVSAPNNPTAVYGTKNEDITLTGGSAEYEGESLSGTFKLNNPSTIFDAGNNLTTCTFDPDDPAYEQVTNIPITVIITKGTLTIDTLPTASSVTVGDTLAQSTLSSGVVKYGDATVAGTWAWTDDTTVVSASGSFEATFTPTTGADNYNTLTENISVTALSANVEVTSITVEGVSATKNESNDWAVTLPATTTSISAENIVVVLESADATYTINPASFSDLVPGDEKMFTIRVVAQNGTFRNNGITCTIATL